MGHRGTAVNTEQQPALAVDGVSFAYGPRLALDRVTFSVPRSQCTFLLGPNGAGKSTLFSLITRLYDAPSGCIRIGGYDVRSDSTKALSRLGVVFQQPTLDLDLTVDQNLRYHAALHGMGRREAGMRIQEELERQAMFDRRKERVRQLNGGHRRRVEVARALLHRPTCLLLDEPTVGLDVPSREAIVSYVHQLSSGQGVAVLWATHLIDEIGPDDGLVILHRGVVGAHGTLRDVLDEIDAPNISEAFRRLTGDS